MPLQGHPAFFVPSSIFGNKLPTNFVVLTPGPAPLRPRPGPLAIGRGACANVAWVEDRGAMHGRVQRFATTEISRRRNPNRRSLGLDAGRLDDRPPFLKLGLLKRAQCLGRTLLTRINLHPQISEPLAHGRIG
jgi:hypothetical protein